MLTLHLGEGRRIANLSAGWRRRAVIGSIFTVTVAAGMPLVASVPASGETLTTNFVTTWRTDYPGVSTDKQIQLPLEEGGSYFFTANWGDGTSAQISGADDPDATHTYGASGTYTVTISGLLKGWRFNYGGDRRKITGVSNWGNVNLGNNGGYFAGADNLRVTATDSPDLSETTNLFEAFYSADLFNGPVAQWDVSNVTNMGSLFYNTTMGEDISNWDTSSVTDMSDMFWNAGCFNAPIGEWDVSSVRDMHGMFGNAYCFNQDLSAWNTSNVTDMAGMFHGTERFNQDLTSWNTAKVTTMRRMFREAKAFNAPIGAWDTSRVSSMDEMFYLAPAFNQPIGEWNTGSVQTMNRMFYGATEFNQPIGAWDTHAVTDFQYTFRGARKFNQPIGQWDTTGADHMTGMFEDASAFKQDVSDWDVANVTSLFGIFTGVSLDWRVYDAVLTKWAALPSLQRGVQLGAGTNKYTLSALSARAHLVDDYGWTVTDGGLLLPSFGTGVSALAFGDQKVGTNSQVRTITVTNGAQVPVSFGSHAAALSGTHINDFSLVGDTCSGATLAPDGNCNVEVRFGPTGFAARNARLTFTTNPGALQRSVDLTGSGTLPSVAFSASSVAFGGVKVGTEVSARITVRNAGNADLVVPADPATLEGSEASLFSVAGTTCSDAALAPNSACTIDITYRPIGRSDDAARLAVKSDAPGSPHQVALTGIGTGPQLRTTQSGLDLGNTDVGSESSSRVIAVSNAGEHPLSVTQIQVIGKDSKDFALVKDECSTRILQPGASCDAAVAFVPRSAGAKEAAVLLRSDSVDGEHTVLLAANGLGPQIALAPAALLYPRQVMFTVSSQAISVVNVGSAPLRFPATAPSVMGADASNFQVQIDTCSGNSLSPGAACALTVAFNPSSPGDKAGLLRLDSNAPGSPSLLPLNGLVLSPTPAKPTITSIRARKRLAAAKWTGSEWATQYSVRFTGRDQRNRRISVRQSVTVPRATFRATFRPGSRVRICVTASNNESAATTVCRSARVRQ